MAAELSAICCSSPASLRHDPSSTAPALSRLLAASEHHLASASYRYNLAFMLSRKDSIASISETSSPARPRLTGSRRVTSSSTHTEPTTDELLRAIDKAQHARAAANHAFEADRQRRVRCQQLQPEQENVPHRQQENIPPKHFNPKQRIRQRRRENARVLLPLTAITNRSSTESRYTESDYGDYSSVSYGPYGPVYDRSGQYETFKPDKSTRRSEKRQAKKRQEEEWLTQRDYSACYAASHTPDPITSTPSSYKRIGKAKSSFSLARAFTPGQDASSVYSSISSPRKSRDQRSRQSMSFLRGGTEFMPESLRQQFDDMKLKEERKSFYLPSSARNQKHIAFADATLRQPKYSHTGSSMKKAVKEKARKISESLFGSVRKVFGSKGRDKDNARSELTGELQIPEQHIRAEKKHFKPYVPPEDIYESDFINSTVEVNQPVPKIRSNYLMPKSPAIRIVSSSEVLNSELEPCVNIASQDPDQRKFSNSTNETCMSWDGTIATRACAPRMPITTERNSASNRLSRLPGSTIPMVDARRVYSALIRRMEDTPKDLPEGQEFIDQRADKNDRDVANPAFEFSLAEKNPETRSVSSMSEFAQRDRPLERVDTSEGLYEPPMHLPPPIPHMIYDENVPEEATSVMERPVTRSSRFTEHLDEPGEAISTFNNEELPITVAQYREQTAAHTANIEHRDSSESFVRATIKRVPRVTAGILKENQNSSKPSLYRSRSVVEYSVLPAESFVRPRTSAETPGRKLRLRGLKTRDLNVPVAAEILQLVGTNTQPGKRRSKLNMKKKNTEDIETAVGEMFGPRDNPHATRAYGHDYGDDPDRKTSGAFL